jgi:hypothetical protein
MDQINYRGYARSVGFDPVKAPYGILDRMQEQASRNIRGMEEHRRAIKQVRDEYASGLERKLNIEQQDRDRDYQRKVKLQDNRQRAIEKNAQTSIQSALQEGQNASQVFEKLSGFSSTISKALTEYKAAKDENDMLAGYMEAAAGGLPMERLQAAENAETLLKQTGEATEQVAEGFQARGGDPYVITNLLTGNKARDYGRLKAYMEMATSEFSGWARGQLDDRGITTAPERTAAMPELFGEFLKQNGLFGLKADFMAPGLMKMRGAYNALIEDARKSDIVAKSSMMRDDSLENLNRSKNGESLSEAFRAISRSYAEDGRTPVGRAKAKELIYAELADTTRYSDQDVERILSEAITDQGTSWKDRFTRDYDDLISKRRQDSQAEFNLDQAEERRQQSAQEKELLKFVQENWSGSRDELKSIIDEAKTQGIPTDRLQAYLAKSNEAQNEDFWNKEFERSYNAGTLFTEDVDAAGVPVTVRETWRNRALEQERSRADAGISQETLKSAFSKEINFNLIGESTQKTPHGSSALATEYALKQFNQKFRQYSKTMEPAKAAEQAKNEVLNDINAKRNGFQVISSADAKGPRAFYAQFTPGNHAGAPNKVDIISTSKTLREFRTNPGVVSERVLTSPGVLADINNRIKAGKPISIPGLYKDMARGSDMSPIEILNAQLKAGGYTTEVPAGFREPLNNVLQDPRLRRILDQPMTQDRLNTAINGSGNAPATVRVGPSGFQDVIALGRAAGFKFPGAMAAMWALESGYGKYHSGKNNTFNIKDRKTGGWKNYASPLESAKDFMYLMTDPKYAPALQAAKTPRQFIEGIAMTYSGQERDYAGKILRVMRDNGFNPDQPFDANPNPARNTNNMRPTLAYISGNIGPTSTGAHLDVKQQDNPNTPKNEFAREFPVNALDDFVIVQDRELGTVPLSRTPITNTFQQHVARGSHGIDYGLYSGTKIFVKNGARVISKATTQHGDKVVIQLPDGRRFSFLHGKSV